ncbi:MAG: T9SS type A sorting domain-containing protein, partial [Elusimicrobiota bacterium]|nr:T9SS type A sorting domain-containing protein [Elusimicrobiota bacterium]
TDTAQVSLTTATLTAGTTQYKVLSGFNASATYYFTLWTADDAQNWSPASNEAASISGAPDTGALTGRVTDASTQPVTGVLVEALGPSGAVEGSDHTDTFGNYSIPALNSLYLTIRAVWAAQDIESSVSKDSIPNGSAGVNFTLSVTYQLASVSGFIPSGYIPKHAAPRPAGARYTTREVRPSSGSEPFIEIYSRGRRIGAAFTDSSGAFAVPNLLPGTYGLRVYNGSDYSKMETIKLGPGQNLVFTPKWDLLAKAGVYAYPNPANTAVNFHFTSAAGEAEVEVFDISGRLVKKLTGVYADTVVPGVNSKKIAWDMSGESIASAV